MAGDETFLQVRVSPRARREEIFLDAAGEICVRLKAAPMKGQANAALIKFLARALAVRSQDVEVTLGRTSRRKTVRIQNLSPPEARERLARWIRETDSA